MELGFAGCSRKRTTHRVLRQLAKADGTESRKFLSVAVRVEHSAFGVCEACQRPIAEARLKAVPWTHLCRDCKEQHNT
jgi:RNA polymerase-binding transcription factor DksA